MMILLLKFNINQHVSFKLTPEGVRIWENHSRYSMARGPGHDGQYVMQLWQAMEVFGKHLSGIAEDPVFDHATIHFDEKDLEKLIIPAHQHDCDRCHILGSEKIEGITDFVDFYFCLQGASLGGNLIARFSSDPSDYHSIPVQLITQEAIDTLPVVKRLHELFMHSKWNL